MSDEMSKELNEQNIVSSIREQIEHRYYGVLTQVSQRLAEQKSRDTQVAEMQNQIEAFINGEMDRIRAEFEQAKQTFMQTAFKDSVETVSKAIETYQQEIVSTLERHKAMMIVEMEEASRPILQNIAQEGSGARDQIHMQADEVANLLKERADDLQRQLDKMTEIGERAEEATRRREEAAMAVERLGQQAEVAYAKVNQQILDFQFHFERIAKLENIMQVVYAVVQQLQNNSHVPSEHGITLIPTRQQKDTFEPFETVDSALPPASNELPRSDGETSGQQAVPPLSSTETATLQTLNTANRGSGTEILTKFPTKFLVDVLTPGDPKFSFYALYIHFCQEWEEMLKAAQQGDTDFFTRRRRRDLLLILHGNLEELLNRSSPVEGLLNPLTELILPEIETAREEYRTQLRAAGLKWIDDKPGV